MGYEDVMLAIKARKAEQTKADIDRRKYVQESVAAKAETQSIYDKIYITIAGCLWIFATLWDIYKLQRYWLD
jgi:hypothetical protein